MRKEGLENLTLTGHTEGKRGKGSQWATHLCGWMAEAKTDKSQKRYEVGETMIVFWKGVQNRRESWENE